MIKFIRKIFQTSRGDQLVPTQTKHSETSKEKAQTLDPSSAPVIKLPPGYRPKEEYQSRWPDGFWDHMNKASSHYKREWYAKAKEEFLHARSLKDDYDSLNTQLLRTYRKLYKKATENKRWSEAYDVLSELFETLPSAVTDTDRRQYNKIIKELQKKDPDFIGQPVEMERQSKSKEKKPIAEIEQNEQIPLQIHEHLDSWVRPKGEKPIRWYDTHLTSAGFVCRRSVYDKELGGYKSSQFRLITIQIDEPSDIDI
ncbi:MAG TPA: hypothetical protein VM658_14895, partial [bacterium]|nr:hypothetical protein [bacterium]